MKTKFFLLFLLLVCCSINLYSQNWLWAKQSSNLNVAEGWSVTTDVSGNILVAGYYDLNAISFGNISLPNAGADDIFLTKYDQSGNVLWAKCAGGTSSDHSYSVTTDVSGNIYLTGTFSSPTISFGSNTLTNSGGQDIFVVKYDSYGNVLWAKSANGAGNDISYCVTTDMLANVYITGRFSSSNIIFSADTLVNTNTGSNDIFLAKYDSTGTLFWAKSFGGTSNDAGSSIVVDASENIYLCGSFSSDTIVLGSDTLTNAGFTNMFFVKCDVSGNVLWTKNAGGTLYDYGISVVKDVSNNIYLAGTFSSSSITFGTYTLINTGNHNTFVIKYNSIGNVMWAKCTVGTSLNDCYSAATDASGNIYITGRFDSPTINFGSDSLSFPNGGADAIFIVKYDSSGKALCASSLTSGGDDNDAVAVDTLGNVYIAGDFDIDPFIVGTDTLHLNLSTSENVFVAKSNFDCSATSINDLSSKEKIFFCPNPFSTYTTFRTSIPLINATFTVDNCFGQTVVQIKNLNGQTITFNRDNLPSGLYFIRLTEENKIVNVDKLVISDK